METTEQQTTTATPTTPVVEAPKTEAPKGDGFYGGKYKSQADFESAHKSLEAKLHQQAQELSTLKKTPTTETAADKTVEQAASSPVGQQVYTDLVTEYVSTGAVSEASLDKAAKALGMPKEVIAATRDSMIADQKKGLENITNALKDDGVTGENVNAFIAHMDKTLTQGQKDAIQTMLGMGNFDALRPLAKSWSKTVLPPGQVGTVAASSGGFANRDEYLKASRSLNMRDAAARTAHEAKMKATGQATIDKWIGRA